MEKIHRHGPILATLKKNEKTKQTKHPKCQTPDISIWNQWATRLKTRRRKIYPQEIVSVNDKIWL